MDAKLFDNKLCVRFGQLRMWAERGLVHIEDGANGGEYNSYSVREVGYRMLAIQDMLGNSRKECKDKKFLDDYHYSRHLRMLEQMHAVCREAQRQGMPDDPSAVRDLKNRRPKTVVVPGIQASCM